MRMTSGCMGNSLEKGQTGASSVLSMCSALSDGKNKLYIQWLLKPKRISGCSKSGRVEAYSPASSWDRCFPAHGQYLFSSSLIPSPVVWEEVQTGAITHRVQWGHWHVEWWSDFPRVTTMLNKRYVAGMELVAGGQKSLPRVLRSCPGHLNQ